ncbi:MAG: helix-turn-helix transcriptional regulator [Deltaproteobacteria bacterium]|nr:helix-turn-helix transcriptional regulator [Deltaproteobacteria bacterium]
MTINIATEKGRIKVIPAFPVSRSVRRKIEASLREAMQEVRPIEELLAKMKEKDHLIGTPRGALIAYMTGQSWTQKRLAKATGISQADISKMVNGKRVIGPATARKLAKAFGVDYRKFL